MANFRALRAVSDATLNLLRSRYDPSSLGQDLDFQPFAASHFEKPEFGKGISLFLYRVMHCGHHRSPSGRFDDMGRQQLPLMPLEAHLLLTVWADDAILQQELVCWMMRTLEDSSTLSAAALNVSVPGTFRDDELVELVPGELSTEDLLRLWETLPAKAYHLSVPYVARTVRVESTRTVAEAGIPAVQVRRQEVGILESQDGPQ